MKKTFPLQARGHAPQRVVEAIKHEARKYVKRERGKKLPEGFEVWEFNCKVGATAVAAEVVLLKDISPAIDAVVQSGSPGVYLEIIAVAAHRTPPVASDIVPPPGIVPPPEPLA
jgi:hypothetical protein